MVSIFFDQLTIKDLINSGLDCEIDGDGGRVIVFNSDQEAIRFLHKITDDKFFDNFDKTYNKIKAELQILKQDLWRI